MKLMRYLPTLVLAAVQAVRAANPAVPAAPAASDQPPLDSMEQRVRPCAGCHGNEGRATREGYFPRIAGKPAGYLFNQLVNFRDGRRHFPIMTYMVQLQSDAYLHELADYFSAQRVPYQLPEPPHSTPQVLARGRQLVMEGDKTLKIPACRSCHGSKLLGVAPAIPGLLGVSQDYLNAQLGAWRTGTRAASAPDCMREVVRRLRPDDMNAATAWLASQAVPNDEEPDGALAAPPPLACGSIIQAHRAPAPATAPAANDPAVERGRELVTLADCKSCHTARGGAAFAGGRPIPTPYGTFYSPNITPDGKTGLGKWSASDFWNALHEGYSRDGSLLYPAFPYTNYTLIARVDSDAIYAYLRSIAPVTQPDRPHELKFPYNHRPLLALWRWLYFRPGVYQSDTRHTAQWNRGAYLVQGVGHCSACHEARNALGGPRAKAGSTGGLVLGWYAPSLTNPSEAGMQHWAEDDIAALLKAGHVSTAGASADVLGPMAEVVGRSLQYAGASDLRAVAVYLKSLPVTTSPQADAAKQVSFGTPLAGLPSGADLYKKNCAACHGNQGEGRAPAAPPLAGNRAVTMASPVDAIRMILFGGYPPGTAADPRPFGMPAYSLTLSDVQIAALLDYVRKSWGNSAPPVRGGEVGVNRGSPLW